MGLSCINPSKWQPGTILVLKPDSFRVTENVFQGPIQHILILESWSERKTTNWIMVETQAFSFTKQKNVLLGFQKESYWPTWRTFFDSVPYIIDSVIDGE